MHDFLTYLFSLFHRGIALAVPAALAAAAALLAAWLVCRRRGKPFPWTQAIASILLVGWAALTIFVTIFRSEPMLAAQWNLHLFLAWREAWQRFTLQIWLNVLLNVALFVPLGMLLPFLGKLFRRWYAALAAGFLTSLAVELTQLITHRGMCDVDDLFTNTLGAVLGWCLAMFPLTLHARKAGWKQRCLACCAVPLLFAAALGTVFAVYALRPYGNLREASVVTADLKNVEWMLDFTPSEEAQTAQVYRAEKLDKSAAEQYAADFAAALGIEFPDAYHYDDLIIFANHSTGDFLNLTPHDGTWEYSLSDAVMPRFDSAADEISEADLRAALDAFGLRVPAEAEFSLARTDGSYHYARFTAVLLSSGSRFLNGTFTCSLREQNGETTLERIESSLVTLASVREETILSPAEAVERLKRGKSFEGSALAQSGAQRITVRSCVLDYQSDTKGFFQPVYRFALALEEVSDTTETFVDFVPALK